MEQRNYNHLDHLITGLDKRLGVLFSPPPKRLTRYPAAAIRAPDLNESERDHSVRLMRVNHAGEVAAQALYKAQALTARDHAVSALMKQSADEEIDHLLWCEKRLRELSGRASRLQPLWFLGSFAIGAAAGLFGDRWNLGFVMETERQVVKHLDEHLQQISTRDLRSRAILQQMKQEEAQHASAALHSGASELPPPVKRMMAYCALVMKRTAYWL